MHLLFRQQLSDVKQMDQRSSTCASVRGSFSSAHSAIVREREQMQRRLLFFAGLAGQLFASDERSTCVCVYGWLEFISRSEMRGYGHDR